MKIPVTVVTVKNIVSFIVFSLFTTAIAAQLSIEDSIFYQKGVNNAVVQYHKSLGDQSRLYNGIQYAGYASTFKDGGHPFFYTSSLSNGSIVYDNVLYPDVQLLYDEVKDVIVFQDVTHRIQLHSERVSRFTILNNNFIRIEKDSSSQSIISTGFYHVLYEGNMSILKREVKTIDEDIRSMVAGVVRLIKVKTYYYIKKDGVYFTIKKEKDVLNVFKDHEKDIQQFIKSYQLNFKNDGDNMLTKVATYYDQLTK